MADEISAIRTMLAKDVISAKLASAYVTVDGNRYLLFQAKSLEATIEKEKEEVAILGRLMKGNKSVSAKGSGTLTIYKNTSLFENMMLKYVNQGVDTYFDLQVVNNDPTSEAGKHTVILTGCNIDKGKVLDLMPIWKKCLKIHLTKWVLNHLQTDASTTLSEAVIQPL